MFKWILLQMKFDQICYTIMAVFLKFLTLQYICPEVDLRFWGRKVCQDITNKLNYDLFRNLSFLCLFVGISSLLFRLIRNSFFKHHSHIREYIWHIVNTCLGFMQILIRIITNLARISIPEEVDILCLFMPLTR